ncbi:MAG TPA: PQQ-binding-like beta-propeller repeat protein [Phenylobacterium sp.]|uniref:PQQ-like beta-propeller repeat protein n=1 Tax=Phenylobacterium sp. TaxID=1871053 RepID=UPI002B45FE18|nr:PQQ-binding-like beta-propeller repeat protein [Phenylobacterium sp.]HKR89233.1 PQQ-binding-like beta-propeller repeat protein [Phenylobacterium sp.]
MTLRRTRLLTVLMVAALGASGCSTLGHLNPFHGKGALKETASEGERISIVPADQKLEVSEALKGVDFALPTPVAVTDWPLPGGTPEQSVENVDAAPNLTVAWRKGIGRGSGKGFFVTAPPIAVGGRVYTMDAEAGVSAHDAQTGAQIWRTDIRTGGKRDREAWGGGLAYADGKIYVSSGFRQVVQLDAATGAIGWRTKTDQPIHAAPTVTGGKVMVVALDNTLLTFDAATGAPSWNYQALSEPARILAASSPAVSGDTVVAAFGSGELVALREQNGSDLWNAALSRTSQTSALSEIRDIPGRPVIYRGDVYAVSHSGVFAATDLRTGTSRWSLPVVGVTSPWAAGDVVYVVSRDGQLICAARDSGQIYWIRDLNEGFKPKRRGGFFGLGGRTIQKPLWSSPILANNRVILASSTGELAAVNAKTGAVDRRIRIGAPVLIGPIASGNTIYMVSDNGQLIALR